MITVDVQSVTDPNVSDFDSVTLSVLARTAITPAGLKRDAIAELMAENSGEEEMDMAIEHINKSLASVYVGHGHMHEEEIPLWLDDYHINGEYGYRVFDEEKMAVKHLLHACSQDEMHGMVCGEMGTMHDDSVFVLTCPFNATIINVINNLLLADELLANESIKDARLALVNATNPEVVQHEIDQAYEELDRAYSAIADDRYASAIDHFKKSWEHSQNAIKYASG